MSHHLFAAEMGRQVNKEKTCRNQMGWTDQSTCSLEHAAHQRAPGRHVSLANGWQRGWLGQGAHEGRAYAKKHARI